MDTWMKYGLGLVLLIAGAYGGLEFAEYRIDHLRSEIGKLNQKVLEGYRTFGKTQEKVERLGKTANTLEGKSQSIATSLETIENKQPAKVGKLLAELDADLEKYPKADDLRKEVGQLSRNVKRLDSKKLTCEAKPREEYQEFASCAADYYKLAEWCSGDCNADDAIVTLCCKYTIDETIAKK